MDWASVIKAALDLLKSPTALGIVALAIIVILLIYAFPLALITWTSWDNTNRLEAAIVRMGDKCRNSLVSTR